MKISKILWPTDFSRSAEKAVPMVKSLTEKYDAEIHVLYVIEDIAHHDPWYGEFNDERRNRLIEHGHAQAEKRLEQICSKYLDGCPMYIRHISMGDPASEILKFIEAEKVDMVVMPTRGQKGIFPFGSVAEKVLRNARVSVVTVPIEEEEETE